MIGFLAIDIGASDGKAFVGKYDRNRLVLEEVHRFPNEPIHIGRSTHWNLISLYRNVLDSIKAASSLGIEIRSVGIDTWGVDFGLIDRSGSIQGDPRHYRDMFKDDSMDYAIKKAGKRWIFDR
ncbi:sugar kinase, partial [Mesotoga sp. SC_4PWL113PWK15]